MSSVFPDPEKLRVEEIHFIDFGQAASGQNRRQLIKYHSPSLAVQSIVDIDGTPVAVIADLIPEAQAQLSEAKEEYEKIGNEWHSRLRGLPRYQQAYFENQQALGWYCDAVELLMAVLEKLVSEAGIERFREKYGPLLTLLEMCETLQSALYRKNDLEQIVTCATALKSRGLKFVPLPIGEDIHPHDIIKTEEQLAWYLEGLVDLAKEEDARREIEKAKASLDLD
ncbi:MAG: hypothetical protein HQL43_02555 [Alphaproteobacteria bacterium]|nr:hypothetical protein [Alphaproteobacteria bacterium]